MKQIMKYIIHACNKRMWYVEEFLVPSMRRQGIRNDDITVYLDREEIGCLFSTMEIFRECGKDGMDAWHLQDDVAISLDFAEKTAEHDDGLVFGFWHQIYDDTDLRSGFVPVQEMGYPSPNPSSPATKSPEFPGFSL